MIGEGVWLVFRTPSFLLILLGNIIGTIVGNNMGYKIMYMQVRRLPSSGAPSLNWLQEALCPFVHVQHACQELAPCSKVG